MIRVKNLRNEKPSNPWDVKIDRSSPLGNPFTMHTETLRDEVCDKYKVYIHNCIKNKESKVCNELNRIYLIYKKYKQLNLYCWCAPKRCHGDIITELIYNV